MCDFDSATGRTRARRGDKTCAKIEEHFALGVDFAVEFFEKLSV
jgi:hypothetical protein